MTEAVELLGAQDVEVFWNKHKGAFDSRAQFDQGLQEYRQAALDRELEDETKDDPALFQQAGGLQNFMQSLDQINTNEQAQAALHQLAMAVEMLQKKGEPVPTIFEKIRKEEGV
jgi:predicted ATPase